MISIRTREVTVVLDWLWETSEPVARTMWKGSSDSKPKSEHRSRTKGLRLWTYLIKDLLIWWTKAWCRSGLEVWIRVGIDLESASTLLTTAVACSTDLSQPLRSARRMPLKIGTTSSTRAWGSCSSKTHSRTKKIKNCSSRRSVNRLSVGTSAVVVQTKSQARKARVPSDSMSKTRTAAWEVNNRFTVHQETSSSHQPRTTTLTGSFKSIIIETMEWKYKAIFYKMFRKDLKVSILTSQVQMGKRLQIQTMLTQFLAKNHNLSPLWTIVCLAQTMP